jgi:hypothetical protein
MSGNNALDDTNKNFLEGFGEYVDSEKKKQKPVSRRPKTTEPM